MVRQDKVLLQANLPKWFRVFYGIGAPFMPFFSIFIWIQFSLDGFTLLEVLGVVFFIVMTLLVLLMAPLFCSSVTATEFGLELSALWILRRRFSWNEIVRVSRPHFGVPRDITYVFSKSGKRIGLLRSMEGYSELLELIQSKAPNLTPRTLPPEFSPRRYTTFWRDALVIFGGLLLYFVAKLIFKF